MIHAGLTSITFRKLSPGDIIDLVAQSGLEGIEWGGDIHVPHGDIDRANRVRRMTVDAGLQISSYGSYYRVGHEEPVPFDAVLDTAVALEAPVVRVWAGKQGSEDADSAYRGSVVEETQRIADMAQVAGLLVAFEFHNNTLNDTNASAVRLLGEVGHEAVRTYWQVKADVSESYRRVGLEALLPWLSALHVFYWGSDRKRRPLTEGEEPWSGYLKQVADAGCECWALIEFVKDDAPEFFVGDARALKAWVERHCQ